MAISSGVEDQLAQERPVFTDHPALLVLPVVADGVADGRIGSSGLRLEAGVESGDRGRAVQGTMRPVVVVVGTEGAELELPHGQGGCRWLLGLETLQGWWKGSTLPQV
ncbi:MAG TPA: hypothetical protein VNH38_00745 [Candidatus Dormibacteraeota bacterium]|nr:hypothetical protein [Candidatus Dormibacteraeota bacterium]